mmetsp:Transcript_19127/g.31993  ORF Transcript_19127/g.31993 Transcript_19127/m.31993 type:complete len:834 (+) Transcript_19127:33-2534(+)
MIGFALAATLCSVVSALDVPFDQDISFRATFANEEKIADWDQLPFTSLENTQAAVHLGPKHDCFVLLSGEEVYAAEPAQNRVKEALQSPYQPWSSLYTMGEGARRLVPSMDKKFSYFVLTNHNVVGFALTGTIEGNGCGKVIGDPNHILAEDVDDWGEVAAVTSSEDSLWVASSKLGVTQINIKTGTMKQIELSDKDTTSLYYVSAWDKLYVGTQTTLYTLDFDTKRSKQDGGEDYVLYHEWITGVIDTAPQQFSYDAVHDSLWLAESNAVHKLDRQGRWWRYGYHQGAPFGNITSVAAVNGYTYVGSKTGLARFRGDAYPAQVDTLTTGDTKCSSMNAGKEPSECNAEADPWSWNYYGGSRYLPDNSVRMIVRSEAYAVSGRGAGKEGFTVLVASERGLTLLETAPWTLAEKSAAFEQFQYPRHDRRKLTAECGLNTYGLLDSFYKRVGDNDGLWTGMHGMGEAYHYASTGSETARKEAWRAFEGLEMLNRVTGAYPTYPARTYCYIEDNDSGCGGGEGDPKWHNSTVYEGVMWKGDTSSDSLNSHMATYPVMYDLVAQRDEEKKRVIALIDGITGGIVKNDLYLIDPTTNEPTTWGFFNPEQVNDNPEHYSERGLSSLEMLGYLASAYSITRNGLYKDTFYKLVKEHGYAANCMNVKIDNPDDDNHSDNELITLAYHIVFYSWQRISADAEPEFKNEMWDMVKLMIPGYERSWLIFGPEYSPLWTGVYAGVAAQPASALAISRSVWTLRRWAIDLIEWPIDNSQRWDSEMQPFHVRDSTKVLVRQLRPPAERVQAHWNSDPFAAQSGSGQAESEPAVWRLPYYLMLYYKLI